MLVPRVATQMHVGAAPGWVPHTALHPKQGGGPEPGGCLEFGFHGTNGSLENTSVCCELAPEPQAHSG